MKKIFLILLISLLGYNNSQAMHVTIPKAKTLQQRFDGTKFMHFIEQTDLIQQLAEQEVTIFRVFNMVNTALNQYEELLKDRPQIYIAIKNFYFEVIEIILKDSPDELTELRKIITILEKDFC